MDSAASDDTKELDGDKDSSLQPQENFSSYFSNEKTLDKPAIEESISEKADKQENISSCTAATENTLDTLSLKESIAGKVDNQTSTIEEEESVQKEQEEESIESEKKSDPYEIKPDDSHVNEDCEDEASMEVEEEIGEIAQSESKKFEYTSGDFGSESDSEEEVLGNCSEEMGALTSRCTGAGIEEEEEDANGSCSKKCKSGGTDTEEEKEKPNGSKKKKNKEAKGNEKKYKQTKLNFSSTKSSEDAAGPSKNAKGDGGWSLPKRWSDRDTQQYRDGYPGKKDNPKMKANLLFYTGKIQSSPNGAFIKDIHEKWWGDYKLLERHHGYIQWLFPIREDGMNWQAQALQLHEAEAIKADRKAKERVLLSYELMLDFYGMKLVNRETGELKRSKNWEECYDNLNWSSHNYLRITRILKSLGELGYEHLKKPFLQFVAEEALSGALKNTMHSLRDYWIGTVKDDADREELYKLVFQES